ncbi:MAG: biopolymer transporter ExbD [Crocinitomicaceae bacterium]|nr:biopolymer transporter ExbD [Crocinitomicaceae bacterium]
MSKFKKDGRSGAPGVNTSSLPDIVFMLLFFFMVATTSKENDPTVEIRKTEGVKTTDLTPYKQRSEVDFIYLGRPINKARQGEGDDEWFLSLDNVVTPSKDGLYNANHVGQWKLAKFDQKPARTREANSKVATILTCIKADKEAPTIKIFEIRDALKDVEAFSVAYAVTDNSTN